MKISVHITFYVKNKKKIDFNKLNKTIKNYLTLSKKTYIYVHTNVKIKKKSKFITFINYNLEKEDPLKLSWKCRPLMKKQKNLFDYFIYSEDDIIFKKRNFNAWFKLKDICIKNNFNLGFLRTEIKKDSLNLWSIDQPKQLNRSLMIGDQQFIVLENPYCAMWIYDKKEFGNFIKSEYWNLENWLGDNHYTNLKTREKSAIGWNGLNMKRYKASIVPIKNFRILNEFYLNHQGDKYIKFGPFSIKVNQLINRKLKHCEDIKENLFELFYLRIKFFYRKYLKINLKNYKSN